MFLVAKAVVFVFSLLALVHFYWALGGTALKSSAVPKVQGRAVFIPTAGATLVVALGLTLCAWLVAATAGLLASPISPTSLSWLTFALGLALLARAVGDFRLVGFFKRERNTRFARMDSVVYAPLCLVLGVAVLYVASANRG